MKRSVQRIKLRASGSPVKLDATIIESDLDVKKIRVRFDGPLPDLTLYAVGDYTLVSDLLDHNNNPTTEVGEAVFSREWNVL